MTNHLPSVKISRERQISCQSSLKANQDARKYFYEKIEFDRVKFFARINSEVIKMTNMTNIAVDSEDLKEFNERSGMSMTECIKILMNSVKYGGKLEFDPFWSEENMKELQRRIENDKFVKHELIEVD